jgi:hypothetical protein
MNRDTMGELDGKAMRMGDVPKDRRAEWVTTIDGKPVRPFRFVGSDGGDFVVKK